MRKLVLQWWSESPFCLAIISPIVWESSLSRTSLCLSHSFSFVWLHEGIKRTFLIKIGAILICKIGALIIRSKFKGGSLVQKGILNQGYCYLCIIKDKRNIIGGKSAGNILVYDILNTWIMSAMYVHGKTNLDQLFKTESQLAAYRT